MAGLLVELLEKQLYVVCGAKCDIYTEADMGKKQDRKGQELKPEN